jgi:hypothetical protein
MNKFIGLLASLCFLFPSLSHALEDRFASSDSAWEKMHFITGVADYWSYEEFPDIMKDHGPMIGFNYAFKYNVNMFYMEANVEAEYGRTTYEGHTMSGNQDITFTQTNFIYMGQAWAGLQIGVSPTVHIIPKVGYLYRKLTDKDDEDVSGDYRREQEYFVIPVGVDVTVKLPVGKLGFTTWISADFRGVNQTFMTDVGGDRDPIFKQKKGRGYYIEGNYMYDMWILGGFIRYWKVENSELQFATLPPPTGGDFFLEPENETISIGLKGGVTF